MSPVAGKRPQLSPDELHQLKWLLGGLLTLIGVSTVFYMDVDAWSLMALTTVATMATLVRPTLPARVPALVHTLAFPAIVIFFGADLWLKAEILPAMVRLDILLLLYRNLMYRQRRDDLQIIVLGLFLVVVAGVLTVSLTFAAQLLIYAGCSLALLLVVTLSEPPHGTPARPPVAPGEVPGWAQHTNWRQLFHRLREVTDWRVVGLGAVLFVGVVGVSALLFLAIPRFQIENSMFLDRFISKKAKSGFSDTIHFGDVTDIQQDNSLALSVDVSDQAQIPASPYWRMLVLDRYENGTFRLSEALRSSQFGLERTFSYLRGEALPRKGPAVYWTFYLESGVSRYLPLLGHFEMLHFREAQKFQLAPYLSILQLREEPVTMTAYRVEGFEIGNHLRDPSFAKLWAQRATQQRRQALHLMTGLTRENDIAALTRAVETVTGGEKLDAAEFGRRVSAWLKKNHAYSLSPAIPRGDGDPLMRWVESREAGHCELFAGACVLLARGAGLPARVVTGFRGGSWNGYSNNFTIRNADAHAWAEIFDEAAGAWLRVDALAPAAAAQADEVKGEAALVSRLDRSWKARLDSLRVFWYRRIVSFDRQSQAETLKAVKQAKDNLGKMLRESFAAMTSDVRAWLKAPWDVRRVGAWGGGVALAGVAFWLWRDFGRVWWHTVMGRRGHRDDPTRREAGYWLRRIGERGEVSASIDPAIVADLQRVRFGARDTWPEPARLFRRTRRAIREARAAARAR